MNVRRMKLMFRIILSVAAVLYGGMLSFASSGDKENHRLLLQLDSIIANQRELVEQKEIRFEGLRQSLAKAKGDAERLGVSRQLYDEYIVYDSDSTLHYASETRRLIEKTTPGDHDELTRWKLNEAFIYTVQGLFDNTIDLLEDIDSSRLSEEMKRGCKYGQNRV